MLEWEGRYYGTLLKVHQGVIQGDTLSLHHLKHGGGHRDTLVAGE